MTFFPPQHTNDPCLACGSNNCTCYEDDLKASQRPQAGQEAGSECMNLLNAIRDNEEMCIAGVDKRQGAASEPRYKLTLEGPERLLVALLNELIRGRGI